MRIRGHNTIPYTVSPDDALWLARAVESEGAVQAQVAAVLVNGFTWARSRGSKMSLAAWVRAYAQPVNPRWFENGDLYLASIKNVSNPDELKAAAAAARRRQAVHSSRMNFSAGTQSAVLAALNGRSEIPANATDYAAPTLDATHKGYTPLEEPQAGRNRLWTRPGAEGWTGYLTDATDAWPWLVSLLVLGFAAWKWGGA